MISWAMIFVGDNTNLKGASSIIIVNNSIIQFRIN